MKGDGMNIEEERKAFELSSVFAINFSWMKRHVVSDGGMYLPVAGLDSCEFADIENSFYALQLAWKAWQASANREGYKLVPLEMHWHKADDLASAEWDKHKSLFCSDNRDMTAIQVEEFRLRWCKIKANKIMGEYKAIIGLLNE